VFGNGQGACINYMTLTHDSPYDVIAFTVDRKYITTETILGLPVVAFEEVEHIYPPSEYKMSIFISYRKLNKVRAEKYGQAKDKGYQLISYISSKAATFPDLIIGDNSFIFENSSIGPFTSIGNDVFIGSGSVIGHNSIIKDHCFVSPHAVILGSTTIEPYCLIGANATIRDGGIIIARECIIGAGASISQNTQERGVYTGNPAKLAPRNSNELNTWLTWGVK
jgi:sugar O-acyltransferase (sialic acid O-acetyltransferase NeuD family)